MPKLANDTPSTALSSRFAEVTTKAKTNVAAVRPRDDKANKGMMTAEEGQRGGRKDGKGQDSSWMLKQSVKACNDGEPILCTPITAQCVSDGHPSGTLTSARLSTGCPWSYPVGASVGKGGKRKGERKERDLKLDAIRSPIGPSHVYFMKSKRARPDE